MPVDKATWDAVADAISRARSEPFNISTARPVGGGSINTACAIAGNGQRYFVKLNLAARLPMFASEALSLAAIRATRTIYAPEPICSGVHSQHSYLVLEHLELSDNADTGQAQLGEQLAAMHRCTSAQFGWEEPNTIGSTPQINTPCADWATFFAEHRLGYQLQLAQENAAPGELVASGRRLQQTLDALFTGYTPLPSLLHGDLWGGNRGCLASGKPVIFDPACYYGDREADLAMTELFGGFDDRFYHSYMSVWAIEPGYRTRKVLYNLYHVLNHYNLFGGGYANQALHMINRLLAEIS